MSKCTKKEKCGSVAESVQTEYTPGRTSVPLVFFHDSFLAPVRHDGEANIPESRVNKRIALWANSKGFAFGKCYCLFC